MGFQIVAIGIGVAKISTPELNLLGCHGKYLGLLSSPITREVGIDVKDFGVLVENGKHII